MCLRQYTVALLYLKLYFKEFDCFKLPIYPHRHVSPKKVFDFVDLWWIYWEKIPLSASSIYSIPYIKTGSIISPSSPFELKLPFSFHLDCSLVLQRRSLYILLDCFQEKTRPHLDPALTCNLHQKSQIIQRLERS